MPTFGALFISFPLRDTKKKIKTKAVDNVMYNILYFKHFFTASYRQEIKNVDTICFPLGNCDKEILRDFWEIILEVVLNISAQKNFL